MARQKGEITKWFEDKGFGFIVPEGTSQEIFVHYRSVFGQRPQGGETVEFVTANDPKHDKPRAVEVRIVGGADPSRAVMPRQQQQQQQDPMGHPQQGFAPTPAFQQQPAQAAFPQYAPPAQAQQHFAYPTPVAAQPTPFTPGFPGTYPPTGPAPGGYTAQPPPY